MSTTAFTPMQMQLRLPSTTYEMEKKYVYALVLELNIRGVFEDCLHKENIVIMRI